MIQQAVTPPRIAVIGCGAIAELYHLPALIRDRAQREQLVLVDNNQARAREMAQRFEIRSTASDYQTLFGRIDAAIVATPPATHFEIAKCLLSKKIHVLCEKPLAESLAEAAELVRIAKAAEVTLSVNQTRRLFPTYEKIRQLIADGTLGTLKSIRYHDGFEFSWPAATSHHFRQGAKGVWSDSGIHLLDTICWWLGAQPRLVESRNDSFGGPEAMATVRLAHQQAQIELKVSRLGRLSNRFRIEGTLGAIDAGNEDWQSITIKFRKGRSRRIKTRCSVNGYNEFAQPLIDNFISVVKGQAEPLISAESTLPAVALLEAAYTNAKRYKMPWNDHWRKSANTECNAPRQ